jgi:hypothetical protein
VAEFVECGSHWEQFFGVHEERRYFGFGGRTHDVFDEFCQGVDGAIDDLHGVVSAVAHVGVTSGAAACFGSD